MPPLRHKQMIDCETFGVLASFRSAGVSPAGSARVPPPGLPKMLGLLPGGAVGFSGALARPALRVSRRRFRVSLDLGRDAPGPAGETPALRP